MDKIKPEVIYLPKGVYRDRIITLDGRITDRGWRSNIIVDRCRRLLAAFMKGDSTMGIQFLALGKGDASWDIVTPALPAPGIQTLTDPHFVRVPVTAGQLEYLDAMGVPAGSATNCIQVTVSLGPGTPPAEGGGASYPLREFGLFGKLGDEEYMIDYVRHPVIHKQPGDTLVRTIRLVF